MADVTKLDDLTKVENLIRQLKEIKRSNEITYPRIMEWIEQNGNYVSLSTLRRVFADGSESNAGSFNYEHTLKPIAEVLLNVGDYPAPADSPYTKELESLKAVIRVQNEENARLQELKEHLEARVVFLLDQISKKDRRMDEKDDMIQRLMAERDELNRRLLELGK